MGWLFDILGWGGALVGLGAFVLVAVFGRNISHYVWLGVVIALGAWGLWSQLQAESARVGREADAAKYVSTLNGITAAALKTKEDAQRTSRDYEAALRIYSKQLQQEGLNAQKRYDDLRSSMRNGTRVVRVRASCPGSAGVPANASGGSLGDGTVELAPEAGQDVVAVRQEAESVLAKLDYFRKYANACYAMTNPAK